MSGAPRVGRSQRPGKLSEHFRGEHDGYAANQCQRAVCVPRSSRCCCGAIRCLPRAELAVVVFLWIPAAVTRERRPHCPDRDQVLTPFLQLAETLMGLTQVSDDTLRVIAKLFFIRHLALPFSGGPNMSTTRIAGLIRPDFQ